MNKPPSNTSGSSLGSKVEGNTKRTSPHVEAYGDKRSISSYSVGLNDNTDRDGDDDAQTGEQRQILASEETRAVKRLKLVVLIVLTLSMCVAGWRVHDRTTTTEYENFHSQLDEDANKVLSTLGINHERILEAMDAFSVSMISYAKNTNQSWPFVLIPDFAVRAEKIRALSNAIYINTYPLVDTNQRNEWEEFTAAPQNNAWVNESIALQDANPDNAWPIIYNFTLWDVIHGYDEFEKEEEQQGVNGTNSTGTWAR